MLKTLSAAILSFALAAAPAVVRAQAEPLVVHHIGPQSGVLAASNKEALDGAQLWLDAFNAKGGVQGRPVRVDVHNDGQDPKRSKELLDELVAGNRKPLALFMPRTTPAIQAMLPVVQSQGIPMVAPQVGPSFVNEPPKREVFTLRASYQKEAEVAIRQQHDIGAQTFGILLSDDAFGSDVMVAVERVFKELKLPMPKASKVDNRKPEVGDAVKEILAQRPQVVLLVISSKGAADFVKGYRSAGGNATFVSLSNTSNADYVKSLGEFARGAIVMQVLPSPFSATTALAREYGAAAEAKKLPLSYAGLYGFASAKLLTLGLAKAGPNATAASLVQALEGLGEVDLGGFRLRYGPGQRTGSSYVDSTIISATGRFMR